MFRLGDGVMHPARGAGVVVAIEERQFQGCGTPYYMIELMDPPNTNLMIPVSRAGEAGLRCTILPSKLDLVWGVLSDDPRTLPDDHKERNKSLEELLRAGDILQTAQVVRDVSWRWKQRGKLTESSKRVYEKGILLLAGELAAAQGIALEKAEAQVHARVNGSQSPIAVV